MAKKILQKEDLVLRNIAKEVPLEQIKSFRIRTILKEMGEALDSQDDGVAIAAPQIGYSLRIFIVSGKIVNLIKNKKGTIPKGQEVNAPTTTVFINPKIVKVSKEKKVVEEGCLSIRYLYGKVSRSNKATIVAYDENGKKFERGGTGLIAQIFQHEIDHLNGILFIDKVKYVEEIIPEHIKNPKLKYKDEK